MNDRILRAKDVVAVLGVSRTTLWRWVKDGTFPQPIQLGPATAGWRESVVWDWIDSREDAA